MKMTRTEAGASLFATRPRHRIPPEMLFNHALNLARSSNPDLVKILEQSGQVEISNAAENAAEANTNRPRRPHKSGKLFTEAVHAHMAATGATTMTPGSPASKARWNSPTMPD